MFTRFDDTAWIANNSQRQNVESMETDALLEVAKALYSNPACIVKLMVRDVEQQASPHIVEEDFPKPWNRNWELALRESIQEITSLSADELVNYAFNSKLGRSIQAELSQRGVNLSNFLSMVDSIAELPKMTENGR